MKHKLCLCLRALTEVDWREPCQARHGISSFQLSPVPQQDVEDVVLGAGPQGAFVHAATHELTVLDHHNWGCDKKPCDWGQEHHLGENSEH